LVKQGSFCWGINDEEEKEIKEYLTLKNLNIKIQKGEFLAIIGEVGAGKSSLISAILGDLEHIHDSVVDEFSNLNLSTESDERKEQIEMF